jgi:hypothetical protein
MQAPRPDPLFRYFTSDIYLYTTLTGTRHYLMRGLVFHTAIQPTAPQKTSSRPRPPKLGKIAQAAVIERRQVAKKNYSGALDGLWSRVQREVETLAVEHHQSVQRVSNDLHMGGTVSLGKHSKISAWNAYVWKMRKLDKENTENSGNNVILSRT